MATLNKGTGLLLLTAVIMIFTSCHRYKIYNWVDWNSVFKPELDSAERKLVTDDIKRQLADVRSKKSPLPPSGDTLRPSTTYLVRLLEASLPPGVSYKVVNIRDNYCSCNDTLLWNVRADLKIGASGGSVPNPKPPAPATNVSGDPFNALAKNENMMGPDELNNIIDYSRKVTYPPNYSFAENAVVAVIDTGLDSLLFDETLRRNLFWNGPSASRNLLMGGDTLEYLDKNIVRHGTSVATLAINSFYEASNRRFLPQLMVLKALDDEGRGNIFEFSCAMSYAMRNKATVINASLGYYGEPNEVLNYYLHKSFMDSVPVVAAAGNSLYHINSICFDRINPLNLLTFPRWTFFPGCMANNWEQYPVISVTGFSIPGIPCYNQNYSPQMVTLGVFNREADTSCCSYKIPFLKDGWKLEGSSFAAPVVAGRLTFRRAERDEGRNIQAYLPRMQVMNAPVMNGQMVTKNNWFITY